MKYASVIVDISLQKLDKTYDYLVPSELEDLVRLGSRVRVSFGNRELTGYVLGFSNETEVPADKIKPILSIEEKSVAIDSQLIELAGFMKDEYACTMNQALKTVIPAKRQIAKKKTRVEQTPIEDGEVHEITLNEEQEKTVSGIISNYPRTALIYGVTGSGKTEVYMRLIDEMIKRGKQTILLIPEISLTLQNLRRFHAKYGERVGVVNSRLSAGEKYETFEKARAGKIDVIIGPRSAVFTPFRELGLIIIDEEHENTYFSETTPRYVTKDVAKKRCEIAGASLVLGSATPLVDDYKKALDGEYDLYKLGRRAVLGSALPQVHIVDLREELRAGNKTIFSRELATAIKDRLEKKEQIMLFLNRRGYAGFVSCRSCGYVVKCPHCDVSMTAHLGDKNGKLICHYCGHEVPMPNKCPTCGSPYISTFGLGTQKLEQAVNKYFPEAKVLRMDTDTTSGKAGHSKILSQFASGKADILIGTQMIVKGHDFPNVTLVGVIAADLSLYSSDYRASERTFQLLTQAAGRAGRAEKEGLVVIQTYNPDDSTILASASQDYESFYEEEISFRKLLGYPPCGRMLSVLMTSASDEQVHKDAQYITTMIARNCANSDICIVGPSDTGVRKIQDQYRCIFFVKSSDVQLLKTIRNGIIKEGMSSSITMDIL